MQRESRGWPAGGFGEDVADRSEWAAAIGWEPRAATDRASGPATDLGQAVEVSAASPGSAAAMCPAAASPGPEASSGVEVPPVAASLAAAESRAAAERRAAARPVQGPGASPGRCSSPAAEAARRAAVRARARVEGRTARPVNAEAGLGRGPSLDPDQPAARSNPLPAHRWASSPVVDRPIRLIGPASCRRRRACQNLRSRCKSHHGVPDAYEC
jgi:hypothetical protein